MNLHQQNLVVVIFLRCCCCCSSSSSSMILSFFMLFNNNKIPFFAHSFQSLPPTTRKTTQTFSLSSSSSSSSLLLNQKQVHKLSTNLYVVPYSPQQQQEKRKRFIGTTSHLFLGRTQYDTSRQQCMERYSIQKLQRIRSTTSRTTTKYQNFLLPNNKRSSKQLYTSSTSVTNDDRLNSCTLNSTSTLPTTTTCIPTFMNSTDLPIIVSDILSNPSTEVQMDHKFSYNVDDDNNNKILQSDDNETGFRINDNEVLVVTHMLKTLAKRMVEIHTKNSTSSPNPNPNNKKIGYGNHQNVIQMFQDCIKILEYFLSNNNNQRFNTPGMLNNSDTINSQSISLSGTTRTNKINDDSIIINLFAIRVLQASHYFREVATYSKCNRLDWEPFFQGKSTTNTKKLNTRQLLQIKSKEFLLIQQHSLLSKVVGNDVQNEETTTTTNESDDPRRKEVEGKSSDQVEMNFTDSTLQTSPTFDMTNIISFVAVISTLAIRLDDTTALDSTCVPSTSMNENPSIATNGLVDSTTTTKAAADRDELQRGYDRAAASAMTNELESMIGSFFSRQSDDPQNQSVRLVFNALLEAILHKAIINEPSQDQQQQQQTSSTKFMNEQVFLDLHIVTSVARALHIDGTDCTTCASTQQLAAHILMEHMNDTTNLKQTTDVSAYTVNGGDDHTVTINFLESIDPTANKVKTASTFAFAAQLRPWKYISPIPLIELATFYDYWFQAERIAESTIPQSLIQSKNTTTNIGFSIGNVVSDDKPCPIQIETSFKAVHTLIRAAMDCKLYRNADTYASKLYEYGGETWYLEARYLHACDTIAKVIRRQCIPVIDKQIQRIDDAVEKVMLPINENKKMKTGTSSFEISSTRVGTNVDKNERDYSKEIREFTMNQLVDSNDIDTIKRFADMWGIEYAYDETAMQAAAEARRKRYLQWEDFHSVDDDVPELISTPEELYKGFQQLGLFPTQYVSRPADVDDKTPLDSPIPSFYGFDVEWGDENSSGASLLQIASTRKAILIDIPSLSNSVEGVDALQQTVGQLFVSNQHLVIGFSCRQDIVRLGNSYNPKKTKKWFLGSSAVRDVNIDIAIHETTLKDLGLSRCCEFYIGKPLDKSEQCSAWDRRPLTRHQRVYAALDALACAYIYEKIHFGKRL